MMKMLLEAQNDRTTCICFQYMYIMQYEKLINMCMYFVDNETTVLQYMYMTLLYGSSDIHKMNTTIWFEIAHL